MVPERRAMGEYGDNSNASSPKDAAMREMARKSMELMLNIDSQMYAAAAAGRVTKSDERTYG